jgi:hypothetical protein
LDEPSPYRKNVPRSKAIHACVRWLRDRDAYRTCIHSKESVSGMVENLTAYDELMFTGESTTAEKEKGKILLMKQKGGGKKKQTSEGVNMHPGCNGSSIF